MKTPLSVEILESREVPAVPFTLGVDGVDNIFGAGHTSAPSPGGGGGGQLPPAYGFLAGGDQYFTFPSVTGLVSVNPTFFDSNGPEGTAQATGNTDITSFGGISGIVHSNRGMFLTGVFLSDAAPGTAPARMSFSNPESFTLLHPRIGQTFFIGDGRADGSGVIQKFYPPSNATRLFLGFAEAFNFGDPVSAPGWYSDNTGQLTVKGELRSTTADFGVIVGGKANIFGAGRSTPPAPGGGGAGVLPSQVTFTPASRQYVTFPQVTGTVRLNSGFAANGPEGGEEAAGKTNVASLNGISGVVHSNRTLFLVGVFLSNAAPGTAPARMSFSSPESFTTLHPRIGQTFFIGDGHSDASGAVQKFYPPSNATRLFLGFVDSEFLDDPATPAGWYGDNLGQINVRGQFDRDPAPRAAPSAPAAGGGGAPAGAAPEAPVVVRWEVASPDEAAKRAEVLSRRRAFEAATTLRASPIRWEPIDVRPSSQIAVLEQDQSDE